jgi:hypothetical protein
MTQSQILLMFIGELFFLALFFYVLYLLGGMYQNVKRILQKLDAIEGKLLAKESPRS